MYWKYEMKEKKKKKRKYKPSKEKKFKLIYNRAMYTTFNKKSRPCL